MPGTYEETRRSCHESCLLPILIALPAAAAEPDPELDVIRTVVDDHYVQGLRTRDFSFITDLCVPEATLMSSNREGKLNVTTLEQWS